MNEVSYIVDTTLQLQECFGIRILMSNLRPPLMKIISTPLQGRIQDFCQGGANFDKNIFQISLIVGLFHPSNHQMVSTPPAQ